MATRSFTLASEMNPSLPLKHNPNLFQKRQTPKPLPNSAFRPLIYQKGQKNFSKFNSRGGANNNFLNVYSTSSGFVQRKKKSTEQISEPQSKANKLKHDIFLRVNLVPSQFQSTNSSRLGFKKVDQNSKNVCIKSISMRNTANFNPKLFNEVRPKDMTRYKKDRPLTGVSNRLYNNAVRRPTKIDEYRYKSDIDNRLNSVRTTGSRVKGKRKRISLSNYKVRDVGSFSKQEAKSAVATTFEPGDKGFFAINNNILQSRDFKVNGNKHVSSFRVMPVSVNNKDHFALSPKRGKKYRASEKANHIEKIVMGIKVKKSDISDSGYPKNKNSKSDRPFKTKPQFEIIVSPSNGNSQTTDISTNGTSLQYFLKSNNMPILSCNSNMSTFFETKTSAKQNQKKKKYYLNRASSQLCIAKTNLDKSVTRSRQSHRVPNTKINPKNYSEITPKQHTQMELNSKTKKKIIYKPSHQNPNFSKKIEIQDMYSNYETNSILTGNNSLHTRESLMRLYANDMCHSQTFSFIKSGKQDATGVWNKKNGRLSDFNTNRDKARQFERKENQTKRIVNGRSSSTCKVYKKPLQKVPKRSLMYVSGGTGISNNNVSKQFRSSPAMTPALKNSAHLNKLLPLSSSIFSILKGPLTSKSIYSEANILSPPQNRILNESQTSNSQRVFPLKKTSFVKKSKKEVNNSIFLNNVENKPYFTEQSKNPSLSPIRINLNKIDINKHVSRIYQEKSNVVKNTHKSSQSASNLKQILLSHHKPYLKNLNNLKLNMLNKSLKNKTPEFNKNIYQNSSAVLSKFPFKAIVNHSKLNIVPRKKDLSISHSYINRSAIDPFKQNKQFLNIVMSKKCNKKSINSKDLASRIAFVSDAKPKKIHLDSFSGSHKNTTPRPNIAKNSISNLLSRDTFTRNLQKKEKEFSFKIHRKKSSQVSSSVQKFKHRPDVKNGKDSEGKGKSSIQSPTSKQDTNWKLSLLSPTTPNNEYLKEGTNDNLNTIQSKKVNLSINSKHDSTQKLKTIIPNNACSPIKTYSSKSKIIFKNQLTSNHKKNNSENSNTLMIPNIQTNRTLCSQSVLLEPNSVPMSSLSTSTQHPPPLNPENQKVSDVNRFSNRQPNDSFEPRQKCNISKSIPAIRGSTFSNNLMVNIRVRRKSSIPVAKSQSLSGQFMPTNSNALDSRFKKDNQGFAQIIPWAVKKSICQRNNIDENIKKNINKNTYVQNSQHIRNHIKSSNKSNVKVINGVQSSLNNKPITSENTNALKPETSVDNNTCSPLKGPKLKSLENISQIDKSFTPKSKSKSRPDETAFNNFNTLNCSLALYNSTPVPDSKTPLNKNFNSAVKKLSWDKQGDSRLNRFQDLPPASQLYAKKPSRSILKNKTSKRKNKSVKFNEEKNQEIRFKQYSWERKKKLQDVLNNHNRQKIHIPQKSNLLEEYFKNNPTATMSNQAASRGSCPRNLLFAS